MTSLLPSTMTWTLPSRTLQWSDTGDTLTGESEEALKQTSNQVCE